MEKELEQEQDLDIHSAINKLCYYEYNGKTQIKKLLGLKQVGLTLCYRLEDPNSKFVSVVPCNLIKLNLV